MTTQRDDDTRSRAAYYRRSRVDDTRPGEDSRGRQEQAVRSIGGEGLDVYADWGISGSGDGRKRPEYQRLLADIASGRVGAVYAESLSRLGRNTRELLRFMDTCQQHNVTVQTAKERVDTSGPMGRFVFTIMAAIGELELDMARERTVGAMAVRAARYESAGLTTPYGPAIYGKRWAQRADGLRVLEDDPERPIGPVLDAYRATGSVLGACAELDRRGVPPPTDRGKGWHRLSLRRILEHYAAEGAVELPEVTSPAGRVPVRLSALFAGIMRCHCGATMTPNVNRQRNGKPRPPQYICCAGRGKGDMHGQVAISERKLREALEPEAAKYLRQSKVAHTAKVADQQALDRLAARREAIEDAMIDGTIPAAKGKTAIAKIDAEMADLRSQAKRGLLLAQETVPDWDDVPAMNQHLRRIWSVVTLDADMVPTVHWGVPAYMYADPAEDGAA